MESRRELATLRAHDGLHTALAFTQDGSTLATASDIGEITLWDLETFEERITLSSGRTEIDCLAFSPRGTALLSGSTDESVRIWSAASPDRVAHFEQSALIRTAQEYFRSENWNKAIATYTRILEIHENLPVRVFRGAAYTKLGLWNEAAEEFAKAAGWPVEDPSDWPALATAKSQLLEKLARYEIDQHQRSKNDDVLVGPAHIWCARAEMHRELNQDAKAEADYLNALQDRRSGVDVAKIIPFLESRARELRASGESEPSIEALESIVDDYYAGKLAEKPTARAFVDRAELLRNRGLCGEAIESLTAALKLHPHSSRAYNDRAWDYIVLGEYGKAVADCDEAIRLDPRSSRALADRAWAYIELGELERAIADCDKAVSVDPKCFWAFQRRSWAHCLKGEFEQAVRDANKAIEINSQNAVVYRDRARAWIGLGDYDRAIADCKRAIEIDPDYPHAYNQLAWALIASQHWDGASQCFNKLVELQPNNIGYLKQLAWCEYMSQGVDASRQRCRTAIERFITPEASAPVKREVVEMCCSVMNAVDDTEAMVQLAQEVIAANPPNEGWSRGVLAQALLCNGQSGEAIPLLLVREADATNKVRGHTMFLLAKAYHAAGKPDVAIEWLDKADNWTSQYLGQGDHELAVLPLAVQVAQKDAHKFLGIPLASSDQATTANHKLSEAIKGTGVFNAKRPPSPLILDSPGGAERRPRGLGNSLGIIRSSDDGEP